MRRAVWTIRSNSSIRSTARATGFKFGPYDAGALLEKIREALYFYGRPEHWQKIQHNGMLVDNSWAAAAKKYIELYQEMARIADLIHCNP